MGEGKEENGELIFLYDMNYKEGESKKLIGRSGDFIV